MQRIGFVYTVHIEKLKSFLTIKMKKGPSFSHVNVTVELPAVTPAVFMKMTDVKMTRLSV